MTEHAPGDVVWVGVANLVEKTSAETLEERQQQPPPCCSTYKTGLTVDAVVGAAADHTLMPCASIWRRSNATISQARRAPAPPAGRPEQSIC